MAEPAQLEALLKGIETDSVALLKLLEELAKEPASKTSLKSSTMKSLNLRPSQSPRRAISGCSQQAWQAERRQYEQRIRELTSQLRTLPAAA